MESHCKYKIGIIYCDNTISYSSFSFQLHFHKNDNKKRGSKVVIPITNAFLHKHLVAMYKLRCSTFRCKDDGPSALLFKSIHSANKSTDGEVFVNNLTSWDREVRSQLGKCCFFSISIVVMFSLTGASPGFKIMDLRRTMSTVAAEKIEDDRVLETFAQSRGHCRAILRKVYNQKQTDGLNKGQQ